MALIIPIAILIAAAIFIVAHYSCADGFDGVLLATVGAIGGFFCAISIVIASALIFLSCQSAGIEDGTEISSQVVSAVSIPKDNDDPITVKTEDGHVHKFSFHGESVSFNGERGSDNVLLETRHYNPLLGCDVYSEKLVLATGLGPVPEGEGD